VEEQCRCFGHIVFWFQKYADWQIEKNIRFGEGDEDVGEQKCTLSRWGCRCKWQAESREPNNLTSEAKIDAWSFIGIQKKRKEGWNQTSWSTAQGRKTQKRWPEVLDEGINCDAGDTYHRLVAFSPRWIKVNWRWVSKRRNHSRTLEQRCREEGTQNLRECGRGDIFL
jgi:hypothetical protein